MNLPDFSEVKDLFKDCLTTQEKYQKIIELGRNLSPFPDFHKLPENIVPGCQSVVYLSSELKEGKIFFKASSDALISAGLAALLILAYNEKSPEIVLKCRPKFLQELNIFASLSPGRSSGLASMYVRMQKDALKFLSSTTTG